MRVIGVREFGGPEQLQVFDVAEPHAGPGEVRIRVHAAAVNPTDTGLRAGFMAGRLQQRPGPHVPGMDAAGVISEVGEGVADWAVGDEVMAIVLPTGAHGGAYADEVVVPAASVARLPAGADFVHACTLPMNGLTAWSALHALALAPGDTLAVTGAAGAFGGYAVELGKVRGLRVVADAAGSDRALVGELGADEIVARGNNVAAAIRAVVSGGVDGLADGAVQDGQVVPAIRDGGGLAVVRGWSGEPGRAITVHRIMVYGEAANQGALQELRRLAEEGRLHLRVADVLPAPQAAEAHRRFEAGGVRGRLVLDFTA